MSTAGRPGRSVAAALACAASRLPARSGLPDPRREAAWLLARAWGRSELAVRTGGDELVPADVLDRFEGWVERRAAGEPAHHLTGSCPFWGHELEVSPAVLVPRPETELLIEAALSLPLPSAAQVLDVGTGSGAIALALGAERPAWAVTASDRSLAALAVARRNLSRHTPAVRLVAGDLARHLAGPFDLVAANLPYVPTGQLAQLPLEVRHDPTLALDGGADGLDLVRRLLDRLPPLLAAGAFVLLELGEDQAAAAAAATPGLTEHARIRDLGGAERVLVLQRRR